MPSTDPGKTLVEGRVTGVDGVISAFGSLGGSSWALICGVETNSWVWCAISDGDDVDFPCV